MATNAKILFGYRSQYGEFICEKAYVRWIDGYSSMLLDQLKKYTRTGKGVDIKAFNDAMEYDSWKLQKIEDNSQYGQMNYHYYIDDSNLSNIICTVLTQDDEFYTRYGVENMKIEYEDVVLNE